MRDIYKPGESKNKLIDVKKKSVTQNKEKVKNDLPQVDASNFWQPKHKKSKASRVLWFFFFLVIIMSLGLGAWYYFDLMPKEQETQNTQAEQSPELMDIDKKIEDLEDSQNNLDDFSDDQEAPAVDLNINY